jgi:hypothetical protein
LENKLEEKVKRQLDVFLLKQSRKDLIEEKLAWDNRPDKERDGYDKDKLED